MVSHGISKCVSIGRNGAHLGCAEHVQGHVGTQMQAVGSCGWRAWMSLLLCVRPITCDDFMSCVQAVLSAAARQAQVQQELGHGIEARPEAEDSQVVQPATIAVQNAKV